MTDPLAALELETRLEAARQAAAAVLATGPSSPRWSQRRTDAVVVAARTLAAADGTRDTDAHLEAAQALVAQEVAS